jgi:hypothetical protein
MCFRVQCRNAADPEASGKGKMRPFQFDVRIAAIYSEPRLHKQFSGGRGKLEYPHQFYCLVRNRPPFCVLQAFFSSVGWVSLLRFQCSSLRLSTGNPHLLLFAFPNQLTSVPDLLSSPIKMIPAPEA